MRRARSHSVNRGSVRIVGGHLRGRRLSLPAGSSLRPTPDRVRETLFNWLADRLPGAVCLDLFAGSGALGFEALSRGARRAVLVDCDRETTAALDAFRSRVAAELERELGAEAQIVRAEAMAYLSRPGIGSFDIVFVDPPYAMAVEPILTALQPHLSRDARIYLERARDDAWPESDWLDWSRRATAAGVAFGLARPANGAGGATATM